MSKKTKKVDKKTRKTATRWVSYVPAAVVALGGLALVVGAIAMSSSGGGGASGSNERPYVGGDLHSLVVAPENPEKVMVGGHDGAAVSEDGGETWERVPDLEGADPMGWVVDPSDPKKMYAGGHPGFYRSEDGGETWVKDNSGLGGTDMHGLGMDPTNPKTLYAYVVDRGLLKSTDGGGSWKPMNAEYGAMGSILVDPQSTDTLYLAGMDGGFRKSANGGKTWVVVGTIPGEMVMSSDQDRRDPDTFYAAGGGAFKSTNGGESWRRIGEGLPGNVSVVAVSPSDSNVVYTGVLESGTARVYRSEDGGESWEVRNG